MQPSVVYSDHTNGSVTSKISSLVQTVWLNLAGACLHHLQFPKASSAAVVAVEAVAAVADLAVGEDMATEAAT